MSAWDFQQLLENLPSMQYLHLGFQEMDPAGLEVLCSGLESGQLRVQQLNLQQCGFSREDLVDVLDSSASNPFLRELHMESNAYSVHSKEEIQEILDALKMLPHTIQAVTMDTPDVPSGNGEHLSQVLVELEVLLAAKQAKYSSHSTTVEPRP